MRTTPLLLLVALAFSFSAQAQAVAPMPVPRPPPTPPAATPGYAPGTPPAPVYTPQGAGAYRGDPLPATPVQRSPNKRVLPATREPGLWAADGEPKASAARPTLFGVDLSHPPFARGEAAMAPARSCAKGMEESAMDAGVFDVVLALPLEARRCIAARAYAWCASGKVAAFDKKKANVDAATYGAYVGATSYAAAMVLAACKGVALTEEQRGALNAVLDNWSATLAAIEEMFK